MEIEANNKQYRKMCCYINKIDTEKKTTLKINQKEPQHLTFLCVSSSVCLLNLLLTVHVDITYWYVIPAIHVHVIPIFNFLR